MRKFVHTLELALVACLAIAAAACSSSDSGSGGEEGGTDTIQVTIVSPVANQTFTTSEATIAIPLEATVVGLRGENDRVECLLDNVAQGFLGDDLTFVYPAVALGTHTLKIQAVQGDGTKYTETTAQASVTITVLEACTADADCDDGDACTEDTCDDGSCANVPITGEGCEEGGEGTVDFPCKASEDCSDYEEFQNLAACTIAFCDDLTSECRTVDEANGTSCDDGNACTAGDICTGGACTAGAPLDCDDDDECTTDACDAAGGCTHDAVTCDDDDACTADSCDSATGCVFESKDCSDGELCTDDVCNPATGQCSNPAKDCTGGNACVTGVCDPATGECALENVEGPCDDGDACTTGDVCLNGACVAESTVTCNDGNPCNGEEECDSGTGDCVQLTTTACGNSAVDAFCGEECDDGGTANGDGCDENCQEEDAKCVSDVLCSDGNPCTADTCDPPVGCINAPLNGTPCNDQDPCSTKDECVDGACTGVEFLPKCQTSAPVCSLFGAEGSTVSCFLKLTRATQADPLVAAIQFVLNYPAADARFINFFDEICIAGVGCFTLPTAGPGASTLSTGHSMSVAPSNPVDWTGQGAVIIVHFTSPTTGLTEAYMLPGGEIVNDPVFVEARFEMLATIPEASAAEVVMSGLVATQASSEELLTYIENQVIIASKP